MVRMDKELKELLTKLLDRLDGFEKRLEQVERVAHRQGVLRDPRPDGERRRLCDGRIC